MGEVQRRTHNTCSRPAGFRILYNTAAATSNNPQYPAPTLSFHPCLCARKLLGHSVSTTPHAARRRRWCRALQFSNQPTATAPLLSRDHAHEALHVTAVLPYPLRSACLCAGHPARLRPGHQPAAAGVPGASVQHKGGALPYSCTLCCIGVLPYLVLYWPGSAFGAR